MTIVLVHGVPEVPAIWDDMIAAMGGADVVTLAPPGFGAPLPDGFAATSDAYRDWLMTELERYDEPVDLVGHDWGGGHAMRVAAARPDLLRSVVTDIAGTADPDYVWHDLAQGWQTPDVGEEMVAAMAALPVDDRAALLAAGGMSQAGARACAEADSATMGRCILSLYRSAVQPNMTRWGDELAAAPHPRMLVVIAHDDPYTGGPDMSRRQALRFGAAVAELDGLGHWWMMQDPARSAAMLLDFVGDGSVRAS
jgi:pimeloyl-ACP methyl ester carboxylesterase